jgi:hypothetical protein
MGVRIPLSWEHNRNNGKRYVSRIEKIIRLDGWLCEENRLLRPKRQTLLKDAMNIEKDSTQKFHKVK